MLMSLWWWWWLWLRRLPLRLTARVDAVDEWHVCCPRSWKNGNDNGKRDPRHIRCGSVSLTPAGAFHGSCFGSLHCLPSQSPALSCGGLPARDADSESRYRHPSVFWRRAITFRVRLFWLERREMHDAFPNAIFPTRKGRTLARLPRTNLVNDCRRVAR